MIFDEETEQAIDEYVEEQSEAQREHDLLFWEGCTVVTAPAGAPPEYITVEVDGVNDPNTLWRGVPGGLIVGDEVLVYENPISHRREIVGSSGATGATTPFVHDHSSAIEGGDDLNPETISQRTLVVGVGCPYATLGAAVAAVPGVPCTIRIMGITTVEAGAVTVPADVAVVGMGEGSVIGMGANTLTMSDDSSLLDVVITHSGGTAVDCSNADCFLFNVKIIISYQPSLGVDMLGDSAAKLYHVVVEYTTTGTTMGFNVGGTATPELWDCEAAVNTSEGLILSNSACTCVTRYCHFVGSSNDVLTGAASTWTYCNDDFDYRNCTVSGTAVPGDGQPVIWFDYTVTAANAAAITAAINWVKGRTRVGDYTISVSAGSHDVGLTFVDIPDEGGGNVILQGDTRVLAGLSYVSGPQTAAAWAALTVYAAGNIVQPTVPNDFYYKCQTAGTSAAGEPAWPTALNGTVVDGTVTWICCGIPNNRAGLANGGGTGAVCMIASAANTLTVTMTTTPGGVASNPNFANDGWQNGDTLIALDNAGAVAVHTITGVAANVLTIGAGAPAMGNLGTAFTLLPNRAIARTAAGPCITNYVSGVKIDGFYLDTATGADCDGIQAQNGSIELENVAIRAEDAGIHSYNDASVRGDTGALSMIDCANAAETIYGGVGMWLTYAIAYDISSYAFRALRGYMDVQYGIVSGNNVGYAGSLSDGITASYAYAINCVVGFYAEFIGSVAGSSSVAEDCTYGYYAGYHAGMSVNGAAARDCTLGYYSAYNSYIYAPNTNANNAGNTTNYSPAVTDTEGNVYAIITFT